jgi:hypothetical protein
MYDTKLEIYNKLKADSSLLNMLALNKPYFNVSGSTSTVNSIIPAGKATGETISPFITIQAGPETRFQEHSYNAFFYIRVYNSNDKSFVDIDKIAQRVIDLLDESTLTLITAVFVKLIYEDISVEDTDEELNLNFREMKFRVLKI